MGGTAPPKPWPPAFMNVRVPCPKSEPRALSNAGGDFDKTEFFSNGKEGCARDCARRRVSERNRRKAAALGAEITQEGCPALLKSTVFRTLMKF